MSARTSSGPRLRRARRRSLALGVGLAVVGAATAGPAVGSELDPVVPATGEVLNDGPRCTTWWPEGEMPAAARWDAAEPHVVTDNGYRYDGSAAAGAPPPGFEPVAVVMCGPPLSVGDPVRLEGDLGPLLDLLAHPPGPERYAPTCLMYAEIVTPVYLVDAEGRAVRVRFPDDGCGHELWGARDVLRPLHEAYVSP